MAGSSCTVTYKAVKPGKKDIMIVKTAWVADDGNGTFPSTALTEAVMRFPYINKGYYLECVKYVPGDVTTPDNSFDIVLNDPDGVDILGGEYTSFDGTGAAEYGLAAIGDDHHTPYIGEQLTIAPANNNTNDATFDFYLYLVRG